MIVHKFNRVIHCSMLIAMFLEIAYVFEMSDTIIVPGAMHFWIIGRSVFSSCLLNATRKHFLLFSSIPPNTHCPSTWWPQWYFLFTNILSSSRFILHTSREKLSQSTSVSSTRVLSAPDLDPDTINMSTSESLLVPFNFPRTSSLSDWHLCLVPFPVFLPFAFPLQTTGSIITSSQIHLSTAHWTQMFLCYQPHVHQAVNQNFFVLH